MSTPDRTGCVCPAGAECDDASFQERVTVTIVVTVAALTLIAIGVYVAKRKYCSKDLNEYSKLFKLMAILVLTGWELVDFGHRCSFVCTYARQRGRTV